MSIGRPLALLTVAVVLSSPEATSDQLDARIAIVIATSHQSPDTFPTFDRVVQLERTSETSANVSLPSPSTSSWTSCSRRGVTGRSWTAC
jgi:hypothetical protein